MSEVVKKVGVFVDFENIHISLSKKNKEIPASNVDIFKNVGIKYGKVEKVLPIAKWSNFKLHEEAFSEFGIRPYAVTRNSKNASDIALTVECMKSLYEDKLDVYVLFAGDADFLPLVNHLLDHEKEVYLYSIQGSTSQHLLRLGKEKHFWIEEEFVEVIKEEAPLDPKYRELIHCIYNGLQRMRYQGRKQLIDFIVGPSKTRVFGQLTKDQAGDLIDAAIQLNLIDEKLIAGGQGANGTTRSLIIRYDNPKVASLPFIKEERHPRI